MQSPLLFQSTMNQPFSSSPQRERISGGDSGRQSMIDKRCNEFGGGMSGRVSPVEIRKFANGVEDKELLMGGKSKHLDTDKSDKKIISEESSFSGSTTSMKQLQTKTGRRQDDDSIDDEIARLEAQLRQLKEARKTEANKESEAEDEAEAYDEDKADEAQGENNQEAPLEVSRSPSDKAKNEPESKWRSSKKEAHTSTHSSRSNLSTMRPNDFMGGGFGMKAAGFVPLVSERKRPNHRKGEDSDLSLVSLVNGRDSEKGTLQQSLRKKAPSKKYSNDSLKHDVGVAQQDGVVGAQENEGEIKEAEEESESGEIETCSKPLQTEKREADEKKSEEPKSDGKLEKADLEAKDKKQETASNETKSSCNILEPGHLSAGTNLKSSYMSFPAVGCGELVVTLKPQDEEEKVKSQSNTRQPTRQGSTKKDTSTVDVTAAADQKEQTSSPKAAARQPVRKVSRHTSTPGSKAKPATTAKAPSSSTAPPRSTSASAKFPRYSRNWEAGKSEEAAQTPVSSVESEDSSKLNGESTGKKTRKIKATKSDIKKLNQFLAQQEAMKDDIGTVETNAAHIMDESSTASRISSPRNAPPPSAPRGGRRPTSSGVAATVTAGTNPSASNLDANTTPEEDTSNKPSWAVRKLRSTEKGELLKKGNVDLAKPISAPRMPVRFGD